RTRAVGPDPRKLPLGPVVGAPNFTIAPGTGNPAASWRETLSRSTSGVPGGADCCSPPTTTSETGAPGRARARRGAETATAGRTGTAIKPQIKTITIGECVRARTYPDAAGRALCMGHLLGRGRANYSDGSLGDSRG